MPASSAAVGSAAEDLDLPDDGLLGGIVRLNVAVTRVLESITGDVGLSLPDYLVLGVIRRSPGQQSAPTAIADVLGRTTGGMSLALDRLEAAGWVVRAPDPVDRRRVVVSLTPAGLDLARRVNGRLHDWESALSLPGDRARIIGVLEALAATVEVHVSS